jgi:hypothetical protein
MNGAGGKLSNSITGELIYPTPKKEYKPHTVVLRGAKLPPFKITMLKPRMWKILTRLASIDLPEVDPEEAALKMVEVPYQMHCLDVLNEWAELPIEPDDLCVVLRGFIEVLMTRTRNSFAEDATSRLMDLYLEHEHLQ